MNYYRCLAMVIAVIFVTGCGADDKTNAADTAETSKYIIPDVPGQGLNIDSNKNAATTPATGTQPVAIAAPAIAGLNPAHGQPGHRCDIAVGAPLDSKPTPAATSPNPTTTTQKSAFIPLPVTPVIPVNNTSNPTTAAGMNPAHGQPGHRCDIAVGAPLNNKPNQ